LFFKISYLRVRNTRTFFVKAEIESAMMGVSGHKRDEKEKMGSPVLIISLSMINISNAKIHAS